MEVRPELELRNKILDEVRKGLRIHCYGMEMDLSYFICTVPEDDIYDYVVDNENGWVYVKCISTDIADLISIEEIARQIELEELIIASAIKESGVERGTGFDEYIRLNQKHLKYKH